MADRFDKIIEGCIAGKGDSQKELYSILSPELYVVCLQYASCRDEANDYMQEGFIRIFTKIGSYRREGSFEGWCRKIMINTALQHLRKKKQMLVVNEEISEDAAYEAPLAQFQLEKEDLMDMIKNLPVSQRIVFNLFAIEGYNHQEISDMTGIPENTSKSHLHRARITLKKMLNIHSVETDKLFRKNVR